MVKSENDIMRRFARLLKNGRMAHAYLFIGPEGVGKTQTALEVAKLINCENPKEASNALTCERCPSCLKMNSGHHPDVSVLDKGENQTIKIEQIRELVSRSQLSPFEAKKKVFIIKDTEHLTLEGANALLKTLEEPSSNSVLFLTTSVPEKNLETVKSRCHLVFFFPLSPEKLAARLKEEYRAAWPDSHFLARFSQGCPGKAKAFYDEHLFERKNGMLDQFLSGQASENLSKDMFTSREETKLFLDLLLSWFRDLMLLKQGLGPEHMVHQDRIEQLRVAAGDYSFPDIEECLAEIVRASRLWGENLNVKLPLILIKERIWARSSKSN